MATPILKDIKKAGTTSADIRQTNQSVGKTQELNVGTSATSKGRIFMSQPAPTTKIVTSPNSVTGRLQKGVTPIPQTPTTNPVNSPATTNIVSQYDTTSGKAGSVVDKNGYDPTKLIDYPTSTSNPYKQEVGIVTTWVDAQKKYPGITMEQWKQSGMGTDLDYRGSTLNPPEVTPSRLESEVSDMNNQDAIDKAYNKWVTDQANAGVDPSTLTMDRFTASGQAEIANKSGVASQELLGLPGTITSEDIAKWGTYEKALVEKTKQKNADALAFAQTQNSLASSASGLAAEQENRQANAAISGVTAAYANNREGVVSTSNAMLAPEFKRETDSKLQQNAIVRQMAQNNRDNAYQQLVDAQASGNDDLAEALAKQISAYDNQIQQARAEQAKINNEATAAAFKKITDLAALSKIAGGGLFTGWTPQNIASTMQIDLGTASMVANLDARIALMDTSDIDYQQKVANLKKTQQEALYSGMTPEQRNFTYSQGLTGAAKDEFLNFAGKNPTYGFVNVNGKIFSTNPNTGEVTQVTGGAGGGTRLSPSGVMATGDVNGKVVTLDQNALFGLQAANGASEAAGMGGISVASSTRDQKQTIIDMAAKWGVDVDPSSPDSVNQAAAKLTAMGHSVAPVGQSNHETGMAVDIYPSDPASQSNAKAQAYIEKMKPFMEANGWKQSTDPNDKGHFNFVGMTIYSDEEKAVMDSIDISKWSTEKTKIADTNLEYADVAAYKKAQGLTPEQKAAADNVKVKTNAALAAIQDIEDRNLWKGAGRTALVPGISYVSMDYNDLKANIDTIISNVALDEIKSLKESSKTGSTGFGAMNEKELTLLTSAKGTLRPEMSEELFKTKLAEIKAILLKANGITGTMNEVPEDNGYSLPEDNELTNRY